MISVSYFRSYYIGFHFQWGKQKKLATEFQDIIFDKLIDLFHNKINFRIKDF